MHSYINNKKNNIETSRISSNTNNNIQIQSNKTFLPCTLTNLIQSTADTKTNKVFNGLLDKNMIHLGEGDFLDDYDVIGKLAFSGCDNLESIVIPNSIKRIEFGAFAHLKRLEKVIIPDSVEIIEPYAFFNCPKLTEVKLSENLTTIKNGTFASCKSLKTIRIPYSVRKIESFAFANCNCSFEIINSLKDVKIDPTAFPNGKSLFTLRRENLKCCHFKIKNMQKTSKETENDGFFALLDKDDIIKEMSMLGNSGYNEIVEQLEPQDDVVDRKDIKDVNIVAKNKANTDKTGNSKIIKSENSKTVTPIEDNINTQIEYIKISPYLKKIEADTFSFCINLKEVDFSEAKSLTIIGENAFRGCSLLTEIKFPASLQIIGKNAFNSCSSLQKVDFSEASSLKVIEQTAFGKCKRIDKLKFPPSLEMICNNVFYSCESLKEVDFSEANALEILGNDVFINCKQIKEIKLPSSLKHIGSHAFSLCVGMKKIDFSSASSLTEIDEYAFAKCHGITEVKFPENLKHIDKGAFYSCNKLEKVDFSKSELLKKISNTTFFFCRELREVILPPNLKEIEQAAFSRCEKLKKIKLPDSIESIEFYAFYSCKSLEEINIPKKISGINTSAFYNCDKLEFKKASNQENINIVVSDKKFIDKDKFKKTNLPLYINGEPNYYDVTQGNVGDCTLVAFLVSLAKYHPEKIKNMLRENEKNDTVTVTLYPYGAKGEYTVTKSLPEDFQNNIKCIWFRMIEKALAFSLKYNSNDNELIDLKKHLSNSGSGGTLNDISLLLFGKTSTFVRYGDGKDDNKKILKREYSKDQLDLFANISSNLKNNNIVTLGIIANAKGLFSKHQYSVLGTRIDEAGRLLINIRDPHNNSSDKRYYTKLSNGEYELIQEPYLYDDAKSGPTHETQSETELDLNMLYEMKTDFRISVLSSDIDNVTDTERERNNTIIILKHKAGLAFYDNNDNIILPDANFSYKNLKRIEDTKEINFDKTNIVKINHLEEANVIVPQGVTTITRGAFTKIESEDNQPKYNFNDKIESIVLSSSVRHIDQLAFFQCNNLKNVDFSRAGSLKTIDNNAFAFCINLTEVKLPDTLKEIGERAFNQCSRLKSIKFPKGLIKLNKEAFAYNIALEKVDCSEATSLKKIADKTFPCCHKLKEIKLTDNIEEIGDQAFCHCYKLQNFEFPSKLRRIGNIAFYKCISLQEADFSRAASLEVIDTKAFKDCRFLREVRFPNALQKIGQNSFEECVELQSIKTHLQLRQIEKEAFYKCVGLRKIDLTESKFLKAICNKAFEHCENLEEVKFSDNLEEIGERTFCNCLKLKKIKFPKSLKKIGKFAFYNCDGLKELDFSEVEWLEQIEENAFKTSTIQRVKIKRNQELYMTFICGFTKSKFEYCKK